MAVQIRVRSDSRQAQQDLARLRGSVENIDQRTRTAARAFQFLATAAAAGFAALGATRTIQANTDAFRNLNSQLSLVTNNLRAVRDAGAGGVGAQAAAEANALATALGDVNRIALQTGTSIDGVGEVYRRLAQTANSVGASQTEIAVATRAIGDAIRVSGADQNAANAAIVQLGQGLAAGTLRGEELNSVLEQTPRLATAIADGVQAQLAGLEGSANAAAEFERIFAATGGGSQDNVLAAFEAGAVALRAAGRESEIVRVNIGGVTRELGFTIGQLRTVAGEGALTSNVVFGGLITQAERLNAEASTFATTYSLAFSTLNTAITQFNRELFRSLGITGDFADTIRSFAIAIGEAAASLAMIENIGLGDVFQALADSFGAADFTFFSGLSQAIATAFNGLGGALDIATGFAASVIGIFNDLFIELVGASIVPDTVDAIVAQFGRLISEVPAVLAGFGDTVSSFFDFNAGAIQLPNVRDIVQGQLDRDPIDLAIDAAGIVAIIASFRSGLIGSITGGVALAFRNPAVRANVLNFFRNAVNNAAFRRALIDNISDAFIATGQILFGVGRNVGRAIIAAIGTGNAGTLATAFANGARVALGVLTTGIGTIFNRGIELNATNIGIEGLSNIPVLIGEAIRGGFSVLQEALGSAGAIAVGIATLATIFRGVRASLTGAAAGIATAPVGAANLIGTRFQQGQLGTQLGQVNAQLATYETALEANAGSLRRLNDLQARGRTLGSREQAQLVSITAERTRLQQGITNLTAAQARLQARTDELAGRLAQATQSFVDGITRFTTGIGGAVGAAVGFSFADDVAAGIRAGGELFGLELNSAAVDAAALFGSTFIGQGIGALLGNAVGQVLILAGGPIGAAAATAFRTAAAAIGAVMAAGFRAAQGIFGPIGTRIGAAFASSGAVGRLGGVLGSSVNRSILAGFASQRATAALSAPVSAALAAGGTALAATIGAALAVGVASFTAAFAIFSNPDWIRQIPILGGFVADLIEGINNFTSAAFEFVLGGGDTSAADNVDLRTLMQSERNLQDINRQLADTSLTQMQIDTLTQIRDNLVQLITETRAGLTARGVDVPAFQTGGRISGPGTGRSDSILARVSNGEFVVNAEATRNNLGLLTAINGGNFDGFGNRLPGFQTGGLVDANSSVIRQILEEEAFSPTAYLDTRGRPTIGYGRLLSSQRISPEQLQDRYGDLRVSMSDALRNAINYVNQNAVPDARRFVGGSVYNSLPSEVQDVLVSAAYNLGARNLGAFNNFRASLQGGDFTRAAFDLLDSRAASQAVFRYGELANTLQEAGGGTIGSIPRRFMETLQQRLADGLPIPSGYARFLRDFGAPSAPPPPPGRGGVEAPPPPPGRGGAEEPTFVNVVARSLRGAGEAAGRGIGAGLDATVSGGMRVIEEGSRISSSLFNALRRGLPSFQDGGLVASEIADRFGIGFTDSNLETLEELLTTGGLSNSQVATAIANRFGIGFTDSNLEFLEQASARANPGGFFFDAMDEINNILTNFDLTTGTGRSVAQTRDLLQRFSEGEFGNSAFNFLEDELFANSNYFDDGSLEAALQNLVGLPAFQQGGVVDNLRRQLSDGRLNRNQVRELLESGIINREEFLRATTPGFQLGGLVNQFGGNVQELFASDFAPLEFLQRAAALAQTQFDSVLAMVQANFQAFDANLTAQALFQSSNFAFGGNLGSRQFQVTYPELVAHHSLENRLAVALHELGHAQAFANTVAANDNDLGLATMTRDLTDRVTREAIATQFAFQNAGEFGILPGFGDILAAALRTYIASSIRGTSEATRRQALGRNDELIRQIARPGEDLAGGDRRLGLGNVVRASGNFINGDTINFSAFEELPNFQNGGRITGPGTGTSDSILARLSNGEFVVNAAATRDNLALLESLNSGNTPGFQTGGLVGRPGSGGQGAGSVVNQENNVTIQVGPGARPAQVADSVSREFQQMLNRGAIDAGASTTPFPRRRIV